MATTVKHMLLDWTALCRALAVPTDMPIANITQLAISREREQDAKIAALVNALEEGHTPPTTFQNCAHPKCKLARAALALAKG